MKTKAEYWTMAQCLRTVLKGGGKALSAEQLHWLTEDRERAEFFATAMMLPS